MTQECDYWQHNRLRAYTAFLPLQLDNHAKQIRLSGLQQFNVDSANVTYIAALSLNPAASV
jgi:hypothetical protein